MITMEPKTTIYCGLCHIWVSDWSEHIKQQTHQELEQYADVDVLSGLPQELIAQDEKRNISCPHCGWTSNQGNFSITGLETQTTICPKCGGEFYDGDRDNADYADVDCEEEEIE
jgi:hypothetical protein